MRNYSLTFLFSLLINSLYAQHNLVKQWDKSYGGFGSDQFGYLQQTSDSGYILGGSSTSSIGGDVSQANIGGLDYWIVKTNALGIKEWDKRFGGTADDELAAMQQTKDGGYILAGSSSSGIGGDRTEASRGALDYWIIKIDNQGQKQWDKRFGTAGQDGLTCIYQTIDGGYVMAGFTSSGIGGDKTQANWDSTNSNTDFWVIKTDSLGNLQWDKRFGGTSSERPASIKQTTDGGYMIGGRSDSPISGDKSENRWSLVTDFWVIKIDYLGNKLWDKRFGGTKYDELESMTLTQDGGYLLAGFSESGISGDKTETNWDTGLYSSDYWIVKIDSIGTKEWDKRFGGSVVERIDMVSQTLDGGYFFTGYSQSGANGDKSEPNLGISQSWILKTNSTGNLQWEKTIKENYQSSSFISPVGYGIQTADGCFIVGNATNSGVMGEKTQANHGLSSFPDYWFIKYCDSSLSVANYKIQLESTNVLCQGKCTGSAQAIASYGIPPYHYRWSRTINDTLSSISNLCAGSYTVTVTDVRGAILIDSVMITEPNNAIYLTTTTDSSSQCIANGLATALATGGNGSYTYLWSNGDTTNPISNIMQGTFSVTVTSGSCSVSDTVTIGKFPPIALNPVTVHTTCGLANGSISLNPSGGNGHYTYIWSNGDSTSSISSLSAGTYLCTISTAQCITQHSRIITSSTPITIVPSVVNSNCGLNNGSITLNTYGGGSGTLNYLWSNGVTTSTNSNLASGTYTVTASRNTCTATATALVDSSEALSSPTVIVNNTTCNLSNGSITLVPVGNGTYTFNWSNGNTAISNYNLAPGTYIVTMNEGVCSVTATATVQASVGTSVTISTNSIIFCAGDSTEICAPVGHQTYLWSSGQTSPCIYTSHDGLYTLSVTDDTCTAVSNSLYIYSVPLPSLSITLPDTICLGDPEIQLSGNPVGGTFAGWGVSNDTFYTTLALSGYNYISYSLTDSNNCSNTVVDSMLLGTCGDTSCHARFTLYPETAVASLWYLLNQSTGNYPLSLFWEWGDGTTDTGSLVTHTYATAGNYNICLTVSDTSGCSNTYCDSSTYIYKTENAITINVVDQLPTSISEVDNNFKITVYPNPATNKLKIETGGMIAEQVKLYNINGQLVRETKLPANNQLDISLLDTGVYLAEIKVKGVIQRIRWVKM